jgi:hypothetical protein
MHMLNPTTVSSSSISNTAASMQTSSSRTPFTLPKQLVSMSLVPNHMLTNTIPQQQQQQQQPSAIANLLYQIIAAKCWALKTSNLNIVHQAQIVMPSTTIPAVLLTYNITATVPSKQTPLAVFNAIILQITSSVNSGACQRSIVSANSAFHNITKVLLKLPSPTLGRPSTHPPSGMPSHHPHSVPSTKPSCQPTRFPTSQPSERPSKAPSSVPSKRPSSQPSGQPISRPSRQPSQSPKSRPSTMPSKQPFARPTNRPSNQPSTSPSSSHPSARPSLPPSLRPSRHVQSWSPISSPAFGSPTSFLSGMPIAITTVAPTTLQPSFIVSPSAIPPTSLSGDNSSDNNNNNTNAKNGSFPSYPPTTSTPGGGSNTPTASGIITPSGPLQGASPTACPSVAPSIASTNAPLIQLPSLAPTRAPTALLAKKITPAPAIALPPNGAPAAPSSGGGSGSTGPGSPESGTNGGNSGKSGNSGNGNGSPTMYPSPSADLQIIPMATGPTSFPSSAKPSGKVEQKSAGQATSTVGGNGIYVGVGCGAFVFALVVIAYRYQRRRIQKKNRDEVLGMFQFGTSADDDFQSPYDKWQNVYSDVSPNQARINRFNDKSRNHVIDVDSDGAPVSASRRKSIAEFFTRRMSDLVLVPLSASAGTNRASQREKKRQYHREDEKDDGTGDGGGMGELHDLYRSSWEQDDRQFVYTRQSFADITKPTPRNEVNEGSVTASTDSQSGSSNSRQSSFAKSKISLRPSSNGGIANGRGSKERFTRQSQSPPRNKNNVRPQQQPKGSFSMSEL